ncbi:MAG TPA: hypothetical protein PLF32_09370 [Bacteroidales bacterium]|nr:hypothetical protein [Bacteroidales bacterium]
MKSEVFNNSVCYPYAFNYPQLSKEQDKKIIAGLFEQLLIFDRVIISTNRLNFGLVFLINKLGINTIEKLIESGYIKFMIWTPMIASGYGRQREDGTIDRSVIYGQPPIMAYSLSDEDKDPEKNIHNALIHFQLHRDRKRIFTKKALKNYIVPNGMEFSSDTSKLILDAYKNNNLQTLGLPYEREPEQLHFDERTLLLKLGYKVLETAILSKYNLKSYDNFEHYAICKQNFQNIGKAYNVADNSDTLFNLEGLPNLKQLFIQERMDFNSIFKIRHLSSAKYYRKWINEVGENFDVKEITKEYLNQIKGNTKFFETTGGKFVRNLLMYGASATLGKAVAGPAGAVAGYALGLLETFWIEALLKGKNPSMFISDIEKEIKAKQNNNL